MPEGEFDLEVESQQQFDELWLVQALRLVHGERARQHGHPHHTFSLVRAGWTLIAGVPLSFTQVTYMNVWHKMCRELVGQPDNADNNIDAAGYLAVLNRILLKEEELAGRGPIGPDPGPSDEASGVGEQELPATEEAPAAPRSGGGGRGARSRSSKGRAGNKRPNSRGRKA